MLFVQAFEKISFNTEAGGDHERQGDIISEDTETMHEPHEEGDEFEIVEDDRHDAHEPRQATGQVDEGENIPEIVEEFQREGKQQHNAMNDDSSDDDDDYHVPHNWSGYDFSKLSVNEGEAVPWEYRQNEVCIGSVYGNSDNMKEGIKRWSTLSLQRQFKVSRYPYHLHAPPPADVQLLRTSFRSLLYLSCASPPFFPRAAFAATFPQPTLLRAQRVP